MLRLPVARGDLTGKPVGTAGPFDRAALIDGVGQVQPVVWRHAIGEALRQLLAHFA